MLFRSGHIVLLVQELRGHIGRALALLVHARFESNGDGYGRSVCVEDLEQDMEGVEKEQMEEIQTREANETSNEINMGSHIRGTV